MPIFQYKCDKCSSVFEHLVWTGEEGNVSCMACDSKKITRLFSSNFGIHLKNGDCSGCKGSVGCDDGGDSCSKSFKGGPCPFKGFST
ncbi:MAG: zinc ribbon domain-containing protein [Candidatus Gracilibacteria bacterium]